MGTGTIKPGGSGIGIEALAKQYGMGDTLGRQGQGLFGRGSAQYGQGQGQLQQSGKYFSTLASGNRSAMTQALAPQIEATNDVYSGTTRSLSRFLRGPEKDLQLAEAERGRAGAVSSLFRGGRGSANSALAEMGAGNAGQGMGLFSQSLGANTAAGGMYGGVAGLSQRASEQTAQNKAQFWKGIGSLFGNALGFFSKGGTGFNNPFGHQPGNPNED
jgi:hypothetical protein